MTPAHIFFIPSVFFLGLFIGATVASRRKATTEALSGDSGVTSGSGRTLVMAFIVFAVIFSVTHLMPQFGGAKAVSLAAHGMPLLDQRPVFSSFDVLQRLDAFGVPGRTMYQRFTYTVDVIFPLSLLIFLTLLVRFVDHRIALNKRWRNALAILPFIWFGAVMVENAIVFTLISQFPSENNLLGAIVGFVTVVKFSLLLLSIASPAILLVFLKKEPQIARK